jgi:hypothetical protein
MKKYFTLWFTLVVYWLLVSGASASITKTDLYKTIEIQPNNIFELSLSSRSDIRIGYELVGQCKTSCIELAYKHETNNFTVSTNGGLTQDFSPNQEGLIELEFKNISDAPQTIRIFKELRLCDSEACALLEDKSISDLHDFQSVNWTFKRIVSKKIERYETSKDNSYTFVKGESIHGVKYEVILLWWLYEDESLFASCRKWIPKYGNYNLPKIVKPKPVAGRTSDLFNSNSGDGLVSNWTREPIKKEKNAGKAFMFSGSYMTKPVRGIMEPTGCLWMDIKPKDHNDI